MDTNSNKLHELLNKKAEIEKDITKELESIAPQLIKSMPEVWRRYFKEILGVKITAEWLRAICLCPQTIRIVLYEPHEFKDQSDTFQKASLLKEAWSGYVNVNVEKSGGYVNITFSVT